MGDKAEISPDCHRPSLLCYSVWVLFAKQKETTKGFDLAIAGFGLSDEIQSGIYLFIF